MLIIISFMSDKVSYVGQLLIRMMLPINLMLYALLLLLILRKITTTAVNDIMLLVIIGTI